MCRVVVWVVSLILGALPALGQEISKRDVLPTSAGPVELFFFGHASLMLTFQGLVLYFDPYGKMADYSTLPKADVVFLTHDHNDHFDLEALRRIQKPDTVVVLPPVCSAQVPEGMIVENGESLRVRGLAVQVVPAYNVVHRRENGQPYHPKGIGNGYVLSLGDSRIYVAGDTENLPELKALRGITCAFLPMSLPSTMSPEMVADLARALRPKILYPYHYTDTDPARLTTLLKDVPEIEVRIRSLR